MSIHAFLYEDARETAGQCSARILELLRATLSAGPRATLAISGGTTPGLMFAELAKARFDWDPVHLFWVDERGVPPSDPQSNYKLAKDSFLDPARFPARNVHRIQAELAPELAARLYAE
jgi:6-phosphogluconolactonase